MKRFDRMAMAVILTLGAVAVPCAAWYVAGSSEARRQAEELSERPLEEARDEAVRLAGQLGVRLEALREVEGRRPFFHYQSHFHDPNSDCACSSVTPSPLANGPMDPFIDAYFQIDPMGLVTLPTFGETTHRRDGGAWLQEQAAMLRRLSPAAGSCIESIDPARAKASPGPLAALLGVESVALPGESRLETVHPDSWRQNMELCGISCDPATIDEAASELTAELGAKVTERVVIEVGPLRWSTLQLEDQPHLAALRPVTTPAGKFYQGFLISSDRVNAMLAGGTYPAHWEEGAHAEAQAALVPIEGSLWTVMVDAAGAMAAAHDRSLGVVGDFQRTFALGTLAAVLAGLGLVSLVWQTDRLARQRSRFAASAAHELRTPLAGMRMYGEMLASNLGNPDKSRGYAHRIAQEADRLGRVVDNVMGYSRLERGDLELRRGPGDLAAAVADCVEGLRPVLEAAGARLELVVDPDLPQVPFDRDAVYQIVQNLVDNAEKYTRGCDDRTVRVGLTRAGRDVSLTVSDHGPGVAAASRERIFKPFTRAADADAPAGLGLGLTLVRALTEAHGGRIECREAAPHGAEFRVLLPA